MLNKEQQRAVEHKEGPLLIIAGAGAGKTKTIAHRVAKLVEGGVRPDQILAITFTNKAAAEMRDRITLLLGGQTAHWRGSTSPFIGTFHGFGHYLLQLEGHRLGLDKFFSIADRDDSLSLLKAAIKDAGHNPKEQAPSKFLAIISREKNDLTTLEEFTDLNAGDHWGRLVTQIWQRYEALLGKSKMLDFDDLLLKPVLLFKKEAQVLAKYQNRWPYLHVDEYQDTNSVQYELVKMLGRGKRNICVVGDVDQSIYGWRGADFKNILRFEQDYQDATVIRLEQNYRSTKTILDAANVVIKKNFNRFEKNLFTERGPGEPITLTAAFDEADEALTVASEAKQLISHGLPPREIAVLYRANFQSRVLEEAMLRLEVPYRVLGVRFFARREVKDVLAYLRAGLNPDDFEALKRIANAPPRGLGGVSVAKILSGQGHALTGKTGRAWQELAALLRQIRDIALTKTAALTLKFIIQASGLEKHLTTGLPEDLDRLENIRELVTLAGKYDADPDGPAKLLAEAALATDQDELGRGRTDAVGLMTVHAAKGLEFKHVFITGLEQDLFPHAALLSDEDRDPEEERRLFYVALTRAKDQLHLSYAQSRTIYGRQTTNIPSEFIFDLEDTLVIPATKKEYLDTIE